MKEGLLMKNGEKGICNHNSEYFQIFYTFENESTASSIQKDDEKDRRHFIKFMVDIPMII